MRASLEIVRDMMVRAQLHAALDVVVDTEEALRTIPVSTAGSPQRTVKRLGELMSEARELLRTLLATPATPGR
jgi:hypothetical protein